MATAASEIKITVRMLWLVLRGCCQRHVENIRRFLSNTNSCPCLAAVWHDLSFVVASGACSGKVALTFHRSVIPNSSRENPFEPEKDRFERGDSNGKYMYIYIYMFNKECWQQKRPKRKKHGIILQHYNKWKAPWHKINLSTKCFKCSQKNHWSFDSCCYKNLSLDPCTNKIPHNPMSKTLRKF